jgi:aryl-alcohol dehydrogenase-like predicted oxidoreductase
LTPEATLHKRPFGSTGLQVSAVTYGAMTIATDPELRDGVAPSLLRALERGVSLIDTARVYRDSEAIIGKTLREWRGERPLLSSKVAPRSLTAFRSHVPMRDSFTPESIAASVDQSLANLGVDCLDVLHLHQWFYLWTHEDDWLEAMRRLKQQGKIRCIAVSAQDHEHDALLEAMSRGLVDSVQFIFNVFESRPAVSLLPLAARKGIGTIARCVLDSGGLTGALDRAGFERTLFLRHAPFDEYQQRLGALRELCKDGDMNLSELALRFALTHPAVSTLTVGMASSDLVERNLAAAEKGPLPAELFEQLRKHHVWTKNHYERLVL